MAINKKSVAQSTAFEIENLHAVLSKAALMDIVIDLVRRNAGDEMLDGIALAQAIVAEGTPVLTARGDKLPEVVAVPLCTKCGADRRQPRSKVCWFCANSIPRPE